METNNSDIIRCASCRTKNRIQQHKLKDHPKCGKCHHALDISPLYLDRPVVITDQNFQQEVMQSTIPMLLVFWASWCSACRSLSPTIDRLASSLKGKVKFGRLNTEESQRTAGQFQVMSLPTMLIIENGTVRERLVGALPEQALVQKLMPHIQN
jgi:thioredoxin 2